MNTQLQKKINNNNNTGQHTVAPILTMTINYDHINERRVQEEDDNDDD
jgi:hypothetical protein